MSKKVWLVCHYAMPPHLEVRVKTIRYAKILQARGYDVLLVTASTIHNSNINLIEDGSLYIEREYEGLKYVHIRCSQYTGSGVKRVINLLQFQHEFGKVMKRFDKPDIIVSECNCASYRGVMAFADKNKIPFITEIRDLWPLSIVEYKGLSDKNPIIKYLYQEEKRMYKRSAAIIFSMEGGKAYIREKKWDNKVDLDKVFYINNGIDISQIAEEEGATRYLPEDKFNVVYAGSIRKVNDIGKLIDSAKLIMSKTDKIFFDIYGEGDERKALEERCVKENITNVKFCGQVSKQEIVEICRQADLNIISVKDSAVNKYGVSWNKLFDYLAAGRPILSTLKVNYDLLESSHSGVSLSEQSPQVIADAIMDIFNMPKEEYDAMCRNAKETAREFDFERLTDRLEQAIEYACNHYGRK